MALPFAFPAFLQISDFLLDRSKSPNQDLYYRAFEEYFTTMLNSRMDIDLANTVIAWADDDGLDKLAWYFVARPAEWIGDGALSSKFRALLSLLYKSSVNGPTYDIVVSILRLFSPDASISRLTTNYLYSDTTMYNPHDESWMFSSDSAFIPRDTETELLFLDNTDIIYETDEMDIPELYNRNLLEQSLRMILPANVKIIFNYKKYIRLYGSGTASTNDGNILRVWLPEYDLPDQDNYTNYEVPNHGLQADVFFPMPSSSAIQFINHFNNSDIVSFTDSSCFISTGNSITSINFPATNSSAVFEKVIGKELVRIMHDGSYQKYDLFSGVFTSGVFPFMLNANHVITAVIQSLSGGTLQINTTFIGNPSQLGGIPIYAYMNTYFATSTLYYPPGNYTGPISVFDYTYLAGSNFKVGGYINPSTLSIYHEDFDFINHIPNVSLASVASPSGSIISVNATDDREILIMCAQGTTIKTYSINPHVITSIPTPTLLFQRVFPQPGWTPGGINSSMIRVNDKLIYTNSRYMANIFILHRYFEQSNYTRDRYKVLASYAGANINTPIQDAVER